MMQASSGTCNPIEQNLMEFNERFKTFSNTELLRIICNPEGYQPEAVETAKAIFSDRKLTEEEIKIANDELEGERQEKRRREQKRNEVEDKVKNMGKSIFDTVNPIQNETPATEKTIKIISLLFGGLFLFQLYKAFGMIVFLFRDGLASWDLSMGFYFFPLLVILVATILFYRRNKVGWLLLIMYLTYSAVSGIGTFMLTISLSSSDYEVLDNFFNQPSSSSILLSILFFAGSIWAISRENIRNVYTISKWTMILTISITAIIAGLGLLALYLS